MNRTALALVCALAGFALSSCAGWSRWPWGGPQRFPEPMPAKVNPLPPGDIDEYPKGPEEVLVVRHADPVKVRPAGVSAAFPLTFYDKSRRVNSGTAVYSAPGGRIEVLWAGGSSITLLGEGTGVVGSPSRGEPAFIFRSTERAFVDLKSEEQVELMGGARLSAHTGPFVLDHTRADVLRVKNQSKESGELSFREEVFTLDPGSAIDLPLLSAGGRPIQSATTLSAVPGHGFQVRYSGAVETDADDARVRVRALGDHEIQALGLRLHLGRDEEAEFKGLGPR